MFEILLIIYIQNEKKKFIDDEISLETNGLTLHIV
jgi:hypothetical protein